MNDSPNWNHLNIERTKTALRVAALLDAPELAVERELINELWPTLHQLRMNGLSFAQISNVLRQGGVCVSANELQCINAEILCEVYEEKISEVIAMCDSYLELMGDDYIS